MMTAFIYLSIAANLAAAIYITVGLVQYYLNHR